MRARLAPRPFMKLLYASLVSGATAAESGDDLEFRAGTTLRYNLGARVERPDPSIVANPGVDDGDRGFSRGSLVNHRLDLLMDLDATWRKRTGARLSAAAWYDHAYEGHRGNPNMPSANHLSAGAPAPGLSRYARRHYAGPGAEILDAFVFGSFELGERSIHVRAGRHTVIWGEALLGGGTVHGITYAQVPLDTAKSFASPGIEAKELYRPVKQVSASLQASPTLSLSAQYYFEWSASRAPEAGTFFSANDALQFGGESLIMSPGVRLSRGRDITPRQHGDWGVAAHWDPEWLQGSAGLYLRRFSDRTPQIVIDTGAAQSYLLNFGSKIDLLGISVARQVGGASVGLDLNLRRRMPLASQTVAVSGAAAYPGRGELLGARGRTLHAVLNAVGSVSNAGFMDELAWSTELTWSRWLSLSQGQEVFKGRPGYAAIDRVSRQSLGLAINLTPIWYQALPGTNVSLPMSLARGLRGNAAVAGGGSEGAGSWSLGLALDVYSRYRIELKYIDFFGRRVLDTSGAASSFNGANAMLADRGSVFLTLKTSY